MQALIEKLAKIGKVSIHLLDPLEGVPDRYWVTFKPNNQGMLWYYETGEDLLTCLCALVDHKITQRLLKEIK